ncbi:MAG: carbon starvation protein CstA [Chloroflexota bacterium]
MQRTASRPTASILSSGPISWVIWGLIAAAGAFAFAVLAGLRGDGDQVNAVWMIVAAVCTYILGYRFYSRFIARRVLGLDDRRATPAEQIDNGVDYVPTNRWVLLGHHFAAIAGAGPLVGPVLAAQFGYLPGTLWIIVGVVLAGAVQDFVILFASMRRNGKSLGQMAKEEISPFAGWVALVAVLLIMALLLAVLALIVVQALAESAWGFTTIALSVPIAIVMGYWMKVWRPGKVLEASVFGAIVLLGGIFVGRWVAQTPSLAPYMTLDQNALAILMMVYGFIASVLPVWVLLCPRDYLSTFMKVGTILLLAVATILLAPTVAQPRINEVYAWQGLGPVVPGNLFPFVFITIACGSISGFHALVSSGTTPKMLPRESDARIIGYGGMLMESFVGMMALIAAATLSPGIYYAINTRIPLDQIASGAAAMGGVAFAVTPEQMQNLAQQVGEKTLIGRTGGAPTLAVGMAQILANSPIGGGLMDIWYHFAIMFEALFILTTVDTGTRVGRFMVQDLVGQIYKPFGRTSWLPGMLGGSAVIVAMWGALLWMGVNDPNGGVKSLWALFGISNQMLAAVALATATTIIIKMNKARYLWVTAVPMIWLVASTFTAAVQRVFHSDPRIGFIALAQSTQAKIAAGQIPADQAAAQQQVVINNYFDAGMGIVLIVVVGLIVVESVRQWYLLLTKRRNPDLQESPRVPSRMIHTVAGASE